MPFFQNPFSQEYRCSCPFGDRQYSLTFSVPASKNQSQAMVSFNAEPYNFSVYANFTINFAIDTNYFKNYATISVNVTGANPAATMASEVVAILMADANFPQWFKAYTVDSTGQGSGVYKVGIRSLLPSHSIRCYITNAGAEQLLRFNAYAGVAELPTYYARDTVANRFIFPDGLAQLIQLDQTDAYVDQPIIIAAGFNPTAMQTDYQLLAGRVGIFNFQKITLDASDRIIQIIEYPAGATVGYIAMKTNYTYLSTNTTASQITQIPYTLTAADLVTPPSIGYAGGGSLAIGVS